MILTLKESPRAARLDEGLNGPDFAIEHESERFVRGTDLLPADVDPMPPGEAVVGFFHIYTTDDDFTVALRVSYSDWDVAGSGLFRIGDFGAVCIMCDGGVVFGNVHDRSSFTCIRTASPIREGIVSSDGEFLALNADSGLVVVDSSGEFARSQRLCWERVTIEEFDDGAITGTVDPEVMPVHFEWDFRSDRSGARLGQRIAQMSQVSSDDS